MELTERLAKLKLEYFTTLTDEASLETFFAEIGVRLTDEEKAKAMEIIRKSNG